MVNVVKLNRGIVGTFTVAGMIDPDDVVEVNL